MAKSVFVLFDWVFDIYLPETKINNQHPNFMKEVNFMRPVGAFFDIDGTLYRDSLMVEHFKKLVKYEVIDPVVWHRNVKKTYAEWKKRRAEYDDYLIELSQIYIRSLTGLNKSSLEFIADQVIKLKGEEVYSYSRQRIEYHLQAGHKIFFISGSPDFLVEKMSDKYAATEFRGTRYETDRQGNFTGTIIPMWDAENKNNAILDFVKRHEIDIDTSYAYGDTNGDYSMFELVGHPVAINPTRELIRNIQRDPIMMNKIDIIIERKDVIFRVPSDVEIL
jgi:HAD superfamily hydrolase (TIGR01490 family)